MTLLIQAANVEYAYGGNDVLVGATFEIRQGDRLALIGANGSGKSTLFRPMAGQPRPHPGPPPTAPRRPTALAPAARGGAPPRPPRGGAAPSAPRRARFGARGADRVAHPGAHLRSRSDG